MRIYPTLSEWQVYETNGHLSENDVYCRVLMALLNEQVWLRALALKQIQANGSGSRPHSISIHGTVLPPKPQAYKIVSQSQSALVEHVYHTCLNKHSRRQTDFRLKKHWTDLPIFTWADPSSAPFQILYNFLLLNTHTEKQIYTADSSGWAARRPTTILVYV